MCLRDKNRYPTKLKLIPDPTRNWLTGRSRGGERTLHWDISLVHVLALLVRACKDLSRRALIEIYFLHLSLQPQAPCPPGAAAAGGERLCPGDLQCLQLGSVRLCRRAVCNLHTVEYSSRRVPPAIPRTEWQITWGHYHNRLETVGWLVVILLQSFEVCFQKCCFVETYSCFSSVKKRDQIPQCVGSFCFL